ncbi:glycosyltransferase family 2 protein [Raoultella ornithinolytica]|uniref:glycosyltransferase family 2 protein n=1 Tax=Raoultella ornithinolytica TaxID=54291 RepID=UPI004036780F
MLRKKILDIIVPVYNQSEVISRFLESASLLKSNEVNVILINDGSTDNTVEIISNFIKAESIENFYLVNKKNGGVSSARNTGLDYACSEYVWFCDPDDQISKAFETSLLDNDGDVDVYVFSYETHNISTGEVRTVFRSADNTDGIHFILNNNSLSHQYWHPASDGTLWDKIYKRESISNIRFKTDLVCSEDFDFNLNFFRQMVHVILLDVVIYRYNVYSHGTLSSFYNDSIFENRIFAGRQTIHFLKKYKVDVRGEIKKHILKTSHLLSKKYYMEPYKFYMGEHAYFDVKIYPFTSLNECLLLALSFFKIYVPLIKLYRFVKRAIE